MYPSQLDTGKDLNTIQILDSDNQNLTPYSVLEI